MYLSKYMILVQKIKSVRKAHIQRRTYSANPLPVINVHQQKLMKEWISHIVPFPNDENFEIWLQDALLSMNQEIVYKISCKSKA